jgi:NTE family protein
MSHHAPTRASRPAPPSARKGKERVGLDLALQGGGSHGAFTWGVLDRLLEPDVQARVRFDGVSGTSAGALNAGVLATGFARGGPDGARAALQAFWLAVAESGNCFGTQGASQWFPSRSLAGYNLDANPWFTLSQQWLKLFSPYQFNPLGSNALEEVARPHVDAKAMAEGPLKLFITATSVRTGQAEVFTGQRLGLPALLASACLPQLFQAVQIDGKPYWDGGYSGNPALWPLIYGTGASDVLLVKINPLVHTDLPDTPAQIADRVNEITFNAGLVGELRAIHFVQRLLGEQKLDPRRYKGLRLHMVADDAGLAELSPSSKLNTAQSFLLRLHGLGRAAAQRWLEASLDDVGQRSSLDIEKAFLSKR